MHGVKSIFLTVCGIKMMEVQEYCYDDYPLYYQVWLFLED